MQKAHCGHMLNSVHLSAMFNFKMCNCTCPMEKCWKMLKNILTFISGQGWFGVIGYRGSGQIHADCINRSIQVNWVNYWSSYCGCCSHCRRCRRRITSTLLSFWPNLHLRLYESLHNNNSLACVFFHSCRVVYVIYFPMILFNFQIVENTLIFLSLVQSNSIAMNKFR